MHVEYHYFDDDTDGMPIITLGTIESEDIIVETGTLPEDYSTLQTNDVDMHEPVDINTKASLIVNYMNDTNSEKSADNTINKVESKKKTQSSDEESNTEALKVRSDLLEFTPRKDGSVNCKLCGKIFASRQHWLKHKYRVHVVQPKVEPVPLNKCEKCLVFFKSRKGYLGHMSSKHSEFLQDVSPVLSNDQTALPIQETKFKPTISGKPKSKMLDTEVDIPNTVLQNYQAMPSRNTSKARNGDKKKAQSAAKAAEELDPQENQERRVKDETFVLGIIEKVHQTKKSNKWQCKLCGEKQSIKRHYGLGTGKECRLQVQKLNSIRGKLDEINELDKPNTSSDEEPTEIYKTNVLEKKDVDLKSKWSDFVSNTEIVKEPEPEMMCFGNAEVVLEMPTKRRKLSKSKATENASAQITYSSKTTDTMHNNQHLGESQMYVENNIPIIQALNTNNSQLEEFKPKECIKLKTKAIATETLMARKINNNSKWAQFADESDGENYTDNEKSTTANDAASPDNDDCEDFESCKNEYVEKVSNNDIPKNMFSLCNESDIDDILDF